MRLGQGTSHHRQHAVAVLVLSIAIALPAWSADDKKPPATTPAKPPAPALHPAPPSPAHPATASKPSPMAPASGRPAGGATLASSGAASAGAGGNAAAVKIPSGNVRGTAATARSATARGTAPGSAARDPRIAAKGTTMPHPVDRLPPSKDVPFRHVTETGGIRVARDEHGRLRDLDRPGLRIHRDLRGERRFVGEYHGRRAVELGRNRMYRERPYLRRSGRVYVQRTYIVGGRSYAQIYRSYRYRGVVYYGYVPAYSYRPAFYGWASAPWPAPVAYRWEWAGEPWAPAYAGYFTPYPTYASASHWLDQ